MISLHSGFSFLVFRVNDFIDESGFLRPGAGFGIAFMHGPDIHGELPKPFSWKPSS